MCKVREKNKDEKSDKCKTESILSKSRGELTLIKALDCESLVQAVVMSEILGKPKAKSRRRR